MMSSLMPGTLFYTTGLNRKHTPTPNTITSDDLDKRYAREPFNGRPWPPSSPVSGVYDIRNTSTKLILINNKRKKESFLRGKSNPRKEEHRYPEPERHSRCSTPVNKDYHINCLDSSSPYYEPENDLDMDWLNRSQRPQNRFAAGSAVNPKRHTSCQVPSDPRPFDMRIHSPRNRPNSRTSLPVNFGRGPMTGYRELTPGEQRYFASITRVYSNNQMVRLKRRQYIDLLNQELNKGLYTKKEYERYRDYIALGRQRQYLNVQNRAMSAPVRSYRTSSQGNETDRSISSINGDDKSSVSDKQDKNSPDRDQSSKDTRQPIKRSSTPDKRPTSLKSNSSKKTTSSGRTSSDKSRSTSAKSTTSATKVTEQNKTDENIKKEQSESPSKSKAITNDNENEKGTDKSQKREPDASDSDTNLPSDRQYSAREGHDRPKSRLGHIPEDSSESKEEKKTAEDSSESKEEKNTQNGDEDKKTQDEKSVSTISLGSTKGETKEDTTQNKKDKDEDYQKTRQSRDDSSDSDSSSEDKDPDKLQY